MSAGGAARTIEPPYYAVIFSSTRTAIDEGYGAMADRMVELARRQPGYLGGTRCGRPSLKPEVAAPTR